MTIILLLPLSVAEQVSVTAAGSAQPVSQGERIQIAANGRCEDARPDCAAIVGERLEMCGSDPAGILQQCMQTCQACSYRSLVSEALQLSLIHI